MPTSDVPMFDLEICRLIGSSSSARRLAERGQAVAGRDILCAGFQRAQALAAWGLPDGLDLVRLWKAAILEYARR